MANAPLVENLTETLQRHLGLQQAQSFAPEDIVADGIARLVGKRGDVERLRLLWNRERAHELVDGWRPDEHRAALDQLRSVLDANLVVQRQRDGTPKTFRPLVPEMVTAQSTATIYRELGRGVLDVLWSNEALRTGLRERIAGWRSRHPLALALAPLCVPKNEPPSPPSALAELLARGGDPSLKRWVDAVVAKDWEVWLAASDSLSVDEQIETMTALTCLHLHVAMLWRLWGTGERAVLFVAVAGQDMDRTCARAAYNTYGFWGGRAYDALQLVAREAIRRARVSSPGWELTGTQHLASWAAVPIKASKMTNARFHERISALVAAGASNPEDALVEALAYAFSTQSGVATKVKDFLRGTGRAVGLVGPDAPRARKRYQIDERALSLLARLHVYRDPEAIHSLEDERLGVDAFLDDIFYRYGIVITRERGPVRLALQAAELRPIVRLLPGDEAMRKNRALLERRLDELRLVRRYSDASAVLHVV